MDYASSNNPQAPARSYASVASSRPILRIKRKAPAPAQDDKRIRSDVFVAGGSSVDRPVNIDIDRPDLENLFTRKTHMMMIDLHNPHVRITTVLDELRRYHKMIVTNGVRINAQRALLYIPFESREDLVKVASEYKGSLGTVRDPNTYDTTQTTDTYFRSVIVCSNALAWDNEQDVADAIREVTGAEISNGIVNIEDNLITIYTPTVEDWLKLEDHDLIYPTSQHLAGKPGFYVLHKFAATNDPKFYKLFMSGLPENAHANGVRDLVKTIGATPRIVGLAFDKETHRALKYCFVFVRGEADRDKLINASGKFTVRLVPINFALANQNRKDATRAFP